MKGVKERVLARLHTPEKVELQAEQIELGLVDELSALLNRMKAMDKQLAKSVQKIVNI